ncbi:MAG TPA: phosphoglucomutase (alpha-D-glucose-1,6-bisphosphate-dependent) [Verrucomicrobiae bacterium]|nr:phosphoglucomutase (alpha-D-glucose-1,6-bisphosphate-dependent) [Verrucomicrobiae bacterium]
MAIHPLAGKPAPPDVLIDPARLERDYYALHPDPKVPAQRVAFGTSGHRGSPEAGSFNEDHIAAITQAICEYRKGKGVDGPLYLGRDTHAVSPAAERTALEVLAAHGVVTILQERDQPTPTPSISRAILAWNRGRTSGLADGIVVTPSHNPPSDGGFKYNPPDGGPADTDVTGWVEARANALLGTAAAADVRRVPYERARSASTTRFEDLIRPYVRDLANVLDLEAVRARGVRIGIDPLGGAAAPYWEVVREEYGLAIDIVNPAIDPTFRFMRLDHDGKIRMDCSSPYAMAGLVELKDRFDVAFGNDADADRHGIVTPGSGLLNPNHYLAVAIEYLLEHRPGWSKSAVVGKTLVTSGLVDRVAAAAGRQIYEVPVGFKWFVPGLFDGTCCFGGEESAGASFLRRDGTVWTTDKDGPLLGLLAAEITAVTGRDPGERAKALRERVGAPHYIRIDTPATPAQKQAFKSLEPKAVTASSLAGEPIRDILTRAPGNGASIGGLKVTTDGGWFAARPSGTENVCKLYAESFRSQDHLERIVAEAQVLIERATAAGT